MTTELPSFAEAPGPEWTVRSHSNVDVVWEHPNGEVRYQHGVHHTPAVPARTPRRRRLWAALVAMSVPATYGLVEAVHHLWALR